MAKEIACTVAVLGGGPAGYVAALRAAQLGAAVVLIEERQLGGVCLNAGCIPTKALLKTAETAAAFRRAREFGVDGRLEGVCWGAAAARSQRVVNTLRSGVGQLLRAQKVTVLAGRGTALSPRLLQVETAEGEVAVACEKMILATGAAPHLPDLPGIGLEGVLTSNEALRLERLPASLVILGGGVIGLEFACLLQAAGVEVTVLEQGERLLPAEDGEVAAELLKILQRQGLDIRLSAAVTAIERTPQGLAVAYAWEGQGCLQPCAQVLVAAGRRPRTEPLQALSLRLQGGGVAVDERLETSVPGVYAAGDVTGGRLLAHLAFMEGKAAAENALGLNSRVNYRAVPSCLYTTPEVASVGLTEEEARRAGLEVKVGRFSFRHNGRALTLGEREGFVKVIAAADHVLVGGHILGANASELISELTLAVTLGAKAEDLADLIHPHPALSEAVWEACGDVLGRALHKG